MNTVIREISTTDAGIAGHLAYEAFKSSADAHRFPLDFPSPEAGQEFAGLWINHPSIYGVAAEVAGRFVGSNFLTEQDPIRGVGPITVAPAIQASGIGRKLMEAVIERGKGAPGIRLVQDAFNTISMSLYASLGFEAREPLALMSGRPAGTVPEGITVRRMTDSDLAEAEALCVRVHRFPRTGELKDAVRGLQPFVAIRGGRMVGYASSVPMWQLNHGVAETEGDLCALLTGAGQQLNDPVSFLLPVRQAGLHRWALRSGFRMVKPMTLMTMGEYCEPRGAWFPSVLY